MSNSKTFILSVKTSDLPFLGELLYNTKLALSINRLLWLDWPNEVAQRKQYLGAVTGGHADPSLEDFKAVDEAGEIHGYLALSRKTPKTVKSPDTGSGDSNENSPFNARILAAVMEMSKVLGEDTEDTEHLEITYICVKAHNRRNGVGTQLMQKAFDKAKADGLPLHLVSEPEAYEFYKALGFRETKHFDIDLAQFAPPQTGWGVFRMYAMVWQPQV